MGEGPTCRTFTLTFSCPMPESWSDLRLTERGVDGVVSRFERLVDRHVLEPNRFDCFDEGGEHGRPAGDVWHGMGHRRRSVSVGGALRGSFVLVAIEHRCAHCYVPRCQCPIPVMC